MTKNLITQKLKEILTSNFKHLLFGQLLMVFKDIFQKIIFSDFYENFKKSCKKSLKHNSIPLFSDFKDAFEASNFENYLNINF